jgi:hypothetical protein
MSLATASYTVAVTGVSAVIGAYAQAVDDERWDDVVANFCPDGSLDLPSTGPATGHEAMRAMFDRVPKQDRGKHMMTSIQVTEWSEQHAVALSDLVVLRQPADGAPWDPRAVGRYTDLLHHQDGRWLFHSRVLRWSEPGA